MIEAAFIGYCISMESVPLMFPPLLYIAKRKRPRVYWGLIAWCCAGEVVLVVLAVRDLMLPHAG